MGSPKRKPEDATNASGRSAVRQIMFGYSDNQNCVGLTIL